MHLDEKPAFHARIEAIRAHPKPGWHACDLLVLAVPPQPVTWILRPAQLAGEPFTMGGRPLRLELLPPAGEIHAAAVAADEAGATLPGSVEPPEGTAGGPRAVEESSAERSAEASPGAAGAPSLTVVPASAPATNAPRASRKVVDLTSRRNPRS